MGPKASLNLQPSMDLRANRLLAQEFEGVVPGVVLDAVEDPEDADGLEEGRAFDAADVDDRPTEGLADLRHSSLGRGIVAADEHVRRAAGKVRMEHVGVADDVEGLHDAALRKPALHLLAARVGVAERERRGGVRSKDQRVRHVDHDFSRQVLRARELQGVLRAAPDRREEYDLSERGGVREGPCGGPLTRLRYPGLRLDVARLARAHPDFVAERHEPASESLPNTAGAENSDQASHARSLADSPGASRISRLPVAERPPQPKVAGVGGLGCPMTRPAAPPGASAA